MHILIASIDRISRALAVAVSLALYAMVGAQVAVVVARYVFGIGMIWLQDAVVFGHALVFLLASAWVLQRNEHVRVDVIHDKLGENGRRRVDIAGLIFFVLPVAAAIGWFSWPYVVHAFAALEGARQPGGLAGIFALKGAILVFTASLALQAIACVLKRIARAPGDAWAGARPPDRTP